MVLVPYAFVALLVGVLVAAVITFAVMGLADVRRRRRLARAAHQQGRRFFPDDPYDMPRRYAEFALVSSGHSARASHVTDGRLAGRCVRAFDFRCELGHGPRRMTRHYSVVSADGLEVPEAVLMWPDNDAEFAPLAARGGEGRIGCWSFQGSRRLAAALAAAWRGSPDAEPSIEARGSALILAAPARRFARGYSVSFEDVEPLLAAMQDAVS